MKLIPLFSLVSFAHAILSGFYNIISFLSFSFCTISFPYSFFFFFLIFCSRLTFYIGHNMSALPFLCCSITAHSSSHTWTCLEGFIISVESCSWLLNVLLCTSERHYLSPHAAAAAKSYPTLCTTLSGSPPGLPVPVLQAKAL